MALLDEQLVEEWLNKQNFFTIRGIKAGVDEIDILAIRPDGSKLECWHVEVQISYRPVGYIGGDTNARRRNSDELAAGVRQWVDKKFASDRKVARRNEVLAKAAWRFLLVHAAVKDKDELALIQTHGVDTLEYREVLNELCRTGRGGSSSSAAAIVEMLNYYADS